MFYLMLVKFLHGALFLTGFLVLAIIVIYQPGTFARQVGLLGFVSWFAALVGPLANGWRSCMFVDDNTTAWTTSLISIQAG